MIDSPAKKEHLALEVCREKGELGLGSPCLQRLRKGVGNFSLRDDKSFGFHVVCFFCGFFFLTRTAITNLGCRIAKCGAVILCLPGSGAGGETPQGIADPAQ